MSIFAELSNDTHSNASAMFSSSAGYAMGFALTSNLIHSNAQAYIANDGSADAIDAGGDLQVKATNSAQITSDTRLESISNSSGNDAGISLVDKIVEDFAADYDYSSKAGTITLQNGDLVRVASDHTAGVRQVRSIATQGPDLSTGVDLSTLNYAELDSALDAGLRRCCSGCRSAIGARGQQCCRR